MEMTVKQVRRYVDMTTGQMATALGMSRWTYEKLEKTPDKFTMRQAMQFCKVTGIPMERVLFVQKPN